MWKFALIFIFLPSLAVAAMQGPARVIDGDTLEVGGERIDLFGIDAPELEQTCEQYAVAWPCGGEARNVLRGVIATRHVRCRARGRSVEGNVAAVCAVGPENLNLEMVTTGMALATDEAEDDIKQAQERASAVKRGMWSGRFVAPAEWRQGQRLEPAPASARCKIKGDIAANGRRWYYVPGATGYDGIEIERSRGERWFCTEIEAVRAGWQLQP